MLVLGVVAMCSTAAVLRCLLRGPLWWWIGMISLELWYVPSEQSMLGFTFSLCAARWDVPRMAYTRTVGGICFRPSSEPSPRVVSRPGIFGIYAVAGGFHHCRLEARHQVKQSTSQEYIQYVSCF